MKVKPHKGSKGKQIIALLPLKKSGQITYGEIVERTGACIGYVYQTANGSRARFLARNPGYVARISKACKKRHQKKESARTAGRRFHINNETRKSAHQARQRYTEEEERLILGGFRGTDQELAKERGRSLLGIRGKRHCLKKKKG